MKFRTVPVSFWVNPDFEDVSPENMYFMLMLMTNPEASCTGVYRISIRQMAFYSKYDQNSIESIIERFERMGVVKYDRDRKEICIVDFTSHSINSGGKPMQDLIRKELSEVTNTEFMKIASNGVSVKGLKALFYDRIKEIDESYHESYHDKDNDIDTDNDIDKDSIEIVGQNNCPTPPPTQSNMKVYSVKGEDKKEKNVSAEKKESHEIEVQEVINYLNDATGRQFDPAAKNSSFVKARLKDGATTKEMKEVIDMKAAEWINNEKMKEYLRPQTLFNKTKYAEYRDKYSRTGSKLKALERLKTVVDDFVFDHKMVFVWDLYQVEGLENIATKLKKVMKDKGDELTMDNLEVVLNQVLERLDDYEMQNFSMKLIDKNFNTIVNAKQRNKKSEWARLVASFDS